MAKYDLYNLSDSVLFLSKEDFYDLIIEICGETEANLIRIQGIQNVQSFIRCKDYFSILNIDCEEVDKLKSVACFQSRNGDYVVKQGIKLNLDNLADALKTKHEKFKKQKKNSTRSSSNSNNQTSCSNDNDISLRQKSNETTENTNPSSNISSCTIDSSQLNWKSVHDHIQFIQDLIEKFSQKIFHSTILKNDQHYNLTVTQDNSNLKALIKCQCGAKLVLPCRSKTKTFVLSNYYAHLTTTNCYMVDCVNKEEKKNKKEIQQSSSNSISRKRTNELINSSETDTSLNKKQKKN